MDCLVLKNPLRFLVDEALFIHPTIKNLESKVPSEKHILFSVAGKSPAIITETLFGLLESKGVTGGEVHLLTTSFGKRSMQVLLGKEGKIAAFNRLYQTSWEIRPEWIETLVDPNNAQPLADLRTSIDNENAANGIVERVRYWTQQPNRILHASIAGGRKTMGIYLTQAMSWFARPEDNLSHVLVSEQFETNRHFYFPLKNEPSHQGIIDFATLPFVRMYGLLPPLLKKEQSYSERVKLSEIYLKDISNKNGILRLDLNHHTLSIDGYEWVQFQPLSTGLYLFLLEHANQSKQQSRFYFKQAFDYRDKLLKCLSRADLNHSKSGLSSLIYLGKKEWPSYWIELGGRNHIEARKTELDNSFGKLNNDLKAIGDVSFQVFRGKERGEGSSRWVNIAANRIQIVE